jgi:type II secretory pathway pseudopilin PulG
MIELVIVLTIILVIAAIVAPSLIKTKMSANESAASGTLHTLAIAEASYANLFPERGFSSDLSALGAGASGSGCGPNATPSPEAACVLDEGMVQQLASHDGQNGYVFEYTSVTVSGGEKNIGFAIIARPVAMNQTGRRSFYIDQGNTIHLGPVGSMTASVNDPVLGK